MIELSATVTGVEQVTASLRGAPERVSRALRRAVDAVAAEVVATAKNKFLHGPRPERLGVKSGTLTRSIHAEPFERGDEIGSQVGTNVPYGRFWELGFQGVEQVRSYVRRQASANVNEVVRRGNRNARQVVAEGVAFVGAFSRQVNQPARPFLVPALQDNRGRLLAAIIAEAKGEL